MGLHPARCGHGGIVVAGSRWGGVVEAQHLARVDGGAECHEYATVDLRLRAGRGPSDGGDLEHVDPVAQPCGHDLPDGGQRTRRGLLDAGAGGRGDLECDGERDGLLVVEQQRRQFGSGVEPVPTLGPLEGHDGIAELAQTVDIAAHGTRADVQPLRQQRPRPVPARLEQREQRQQSG